MRSGAGSRRLAAAIVSAAMAAGVAGAPRAAVGQSTVPEPAPTVSPTPPPAPPPPGPQSGTRVVAATVTDDGADLDLRVVVFESDVLGVDGGWSVTVSAEAGTRGQVTSEAVTITGSGGVPRSTSTAGDADRAATVFAVSGQQAGVSYRARYLAFGGVSFPAGRPDRPVVTVTLVQ
ncbi:MAG TPA: hypothetical protein VGA69_01230 [Nitriliruptorales bacterium]